MKKLLIITALVTAFACQPASEQQQTENAASGQSSENWQPYGDGIGPEGAVDAAGITRLAEGKDSVFVKVRAEVLGSCPMKGCWMKVKLDDGEEMRVTFKDYGFFVPKDLEGEEAIFEGYLSKTVTDVESLRHYAEDAGASQEEIQAINTPEEAYTFEATGVLIKPKGS